MGEAPAWLQTQIRPRRMAGTPLELKLSVISAYDLTFEAWAVCSRNLWEA